MSVEPASLRERLERATVAEKELVLRFLLGKRTAEMGRASPELDIFLAELQVELPGAVELLGDLRFELGEALHSDVGRWAGGGIDLASLYCRVIDRYVALFCDD